MFIFVDFFGVTQDLTEFEGVFLEEFSVWKIPREKEQLVRNAFNDFFKTDNAVIYSSQVFELITEKDKTEDLVNNTTDETDDSSDSESPTFRRKRIEQKDITSF